MSTIPAIALDRSTPALARFVGRERELAEIRRLLASARLLTLTGPGGVGKSRLAMEVAAAVSAEFADGIAFVPLAPIRHPDLVLPAIAQAVGASDQGARRLADTVADELRGKHLLLVLDNFEQVLAAAPSAATLVARCPRLVALVTSRAALHCPGEVVLSVDPLQLPDSTRPPSLERRLPSDAVRLFVERARAARPDFALTEETTPLVVEICRRLDGLPLAIELAAARIAALAPQALLDRLEHRLPALSEALPGARQHQRTLRDAIAWSYALLNPTEQAAFRRLGVFAGGCTLEAAEAVTWGGDEGMRGGGPEAKDDLSVFRSLVEKSLLRLDADSAGVRFTMLETIREYAEEQLGASGEHGMIHARYAAYYAAMAVQAEPQLRGAHPADCLERIEAEHANLRAALGWCLEHDAATALQLAGALWWFWMLRGYWNEGRAWLARALAAAGAARSGRAVAKVLYGAGHLAVLQGDYTAARRLLQDSVAILRRLGDKAGLADALHWLGREYSNPAAGDWLEESLALRRELGDQRGVAETLGSLGEHARQHGDVASGRSLGEESLSIWRSLGDEFNAALELYRLGHVARHQDDYALARSLYEESLSLNRALRHTWGVAMALQNLGFVEQHDGNNARAAALARESLLLNRDLGNRWGICRSFHLLAATAIEGASDHRAVERAARLLGASDTLKAAIGMAWQPADRAEHDRWVALTRARLDEATFTRAWSAGAALPLESAIAFALADEP